MGNGIVLFVCLFVCLFVLLGLFTFHLGKFRGFGDLNWMQCAMDAPFVWYLEVHTCLC